MRLSPEGAPSAVATLLPARILCAMFEGIPQQQVTPVTLYTDSYLVRGTLHARLRRLSDILNEAESDFLVLESVKFEEFGSHALVEDVPYAQINLATVLFGVADAPFETTPEMRMPKVPEEAIISLPPFRITGRIHLMPGRELRDELSQLDGRFLPVTDATFWSERLNEPRTTAPMLAFSHARAHILAPHAERDVWAGLGATSPGEARPAGDGWETTESETAERPAAAADPWRDLPA